MKILACRDSWLGDGQEKAENRLRNGLQSVSVRKPAMYPAVIQVTPQDDYRRNVPRPKVPRRSRARSRALRVVFENGEQGELDIKPLLDFGVFQRIKDYHAFKRVRVSFDTVACDCGVDLDPEYVYTKCMRYVPRPKVPRRSRAWYMPRRSRAVERVPS